MSQSHRAKAAKKVREIESAMGDGIKKILEEELPIAKNLRQHLELN